MPVVRNASSSWQVWSAATDVLVIDASAFTELIVGGAGAEMIREAIADDGEWCVPEHFSIEVLSALRGLWLGRRISSEAFATAADRLGATALATYSVRPLITRIVELAPNVSAYDAGYVALAESVDAPLVSTDRRLRAAPGPRCLFLPAEVGSA